MEEPIDKYFHRKVASPLVLKIDKLKFITPNRITLFSLILGLLSSRQLYYDNLLSGFFLCVASIVFDCMDGQLARLRNKCSYVGRVFDGLSDCFVSLSLITVMFVKLVENEYVNENFGWLMYFCGLVMYQQQAMMYDSMKNIYVQMEQGPPPWVEIKEINLEIFKYRESKQYFKLFTLIFYKRGYLTCQKYTAPINIDSTEYNQEFRDDWYNFLEFAAWGGTGSHMFFIYTSILLNWFFSTTIFYWLFFFYNNVVGFFIIEANNKAMRMLKN